MMHGPLNVKHMGTIKVTATCWMVLGSIPSGIKVCFCFLKLSRLALGGCTHPPAMGAEAIPKEKSGQCVALTTHLCPVPMLGPSRSALPPFVFMGCYRDN